MQRLALMWAFKSFHPERANEQKCKLKFDTVEKRRRFLMIDLGARVYELEKGRPPRTITDLVPSYLKAIPQDPFTGTNLVYAFPSK